MLRNFLIVLVGIIAYIYVFIKKRKNIKKEITINILFVIFLLISTSYNKNSSILETLWIISYFGIASLIYFFPLSEKITKYIYYIVAITFIYFFYRGIDPNIIFKSASRNLVSVILLYHSCLYYMILYKRKKKYDIYPAILTFLLCLWALGRAGILVSFFLLFFIMMNILKKRKGKIIFLFFILIMCCIGEKYLSELFINASKRFEKDGLESSRIILLKEYFYFLKNEVINLVFGVPYSMGEYLNYHKNPHNSLLTLHAKFGLLGFLVGFISLGRYFLRKLYNKKKFEFIIGSCLVIRALLDWVAFPGLFDIFFWYIILENSKKGERE